MPVNVPMADGSVRIVVAPSSGVANRMLLSSKNLGTSNVTTPLTDNQIKNLQETFKANAKIQEIINNKNAEIITFKPPVDIKFEKTWVQWGWQEDIWSQTEKNKICDAIGIICTKIDVLINSVNQVEHVLSSSDYKKVQKYIDDYKKVLLGIKRFTEGEYPVIFRQYDFGNSSDAIAMTWDYSRVIALNTNTQKPRGVNDWHNLNTNELSRKIFHELTHHFGTRDDDSKSALMNAHNLELIFDRANPDFVSTMVFKTLLHDLNITVKISHK
jgi:hypothetical protein